MIVVLDCLIDLNVGGLIIVLLVSLFDMRMGICCLLLACLFLVFSVFACGIWFMLLVLVLVNLNWCNCWIFGVVLLVLDV